MLGVKTQTNMKHWKKLLHPQVLKDSLITASIYLSAYEMCRSSIIDKPKSFFSDLSNNEIILNREEYDKEVMSLSKSPLEASLLWFKNMAVITDKDIESFNEARKLRNKLAHDLPTFISTPGHEINSEEFHKLTSVTHKVGVWWVLNYELSIDPSYNGEEIKIGTILMIQMMMDIAYGNEPEEGYYYKLVIEKHDS